jgi:predicted acetyltransferase
MPKLVKPSEKYKKSYLAALKEFERDKNNLEYKYEDIAKDFRSFIKKLKQREKGVDLPRGYVPDSHFWYVEGSRFLGRISIRHKLNKKLKIRGGHIGYAVRPPERKKGYASTMLKLVLPEAKKLGLKKVMLTVAKNNIASQKVMIKNGAKFKDYSPDGSMRFWINLK